MRAMMSLIESLMPDVRSGARIVLPAASLLTLIVIAAAWLPVRRAVAIEPASALEQW